MPRIFKTLAVILPALISLPLNATAQTFFTGQFSAAQQTSDVASQGSGTAAAALTAEGLRFFATVDSLSGPIVAAHFHNGAAGEAGPVVRGVTDDFVGNTVSGLWTGADDQPLTEELIAALANGALYLNVHTAENPGGEVRAQLFASSGVGMTAALTASQQTADVESDGSGTATVQVTDAGVIYHLTTSGLSGPMAAAHFHNAITGTNGPVVRPITDSFDGNTAFGIWNASEESLTPETLTDLLLGNLYLNVHTAANPGGEIRGQVLLTSGWGFSAALNADQVTSEVTSDATGSASVTLTSAGAFFTVTASGLSGPVSVAHFHRASTGENGPPVRTITDDFVGATATGFWSSDDDEPLNDDVIQALIAGDLYLNIHTAANPGGEIRGQITADEVGLRAHLNAAQQTADVESSGSGTAAMNLVSEGLGFSVTVDSLSGPIAAAHFHRAATGENGPVVRSITDDFIGNTATGMWMSSDDEPLTDDLRKDLLAGNVYLNVHTAANPGGEIRGQVHPSAGTALAASLTSAQQSNEVDSRGSGTGSAILTGGGVVFSVTVDSLSGPIAAAHFHRAPAGENGGVVRSIGSDFTGNTARGVWTQSDDEPLTADLIQALLLGELYVNVHTANAPAGELRGQLRAASGIGSAIQLDGGQQPVVVEGTASGTASVTLTNAGLLFDVSATGLTGPIAAAHFHNATSGANGPVVRGLSDDFDGATARGVWSSSDDQSLTPELVNAILAGEVYVNVHTAANPAGEIRGQLLPNRVVATATEETFAEVPSGLTLHQNYPNPFNPTTTIEFGLAEQSFVRLTVFDALGRRVSALVDAEFPAGTFRTTFESRGLPSGLYFYRLESGGAQLTQRMFLLK